jgi:hypothetical protein
VLASKQHRDAFNDTQVSLLTEIVKTNTQPRQQDRDGHTTAPAKTEKVNFFGRRQDSSARLVDYC